MAINKAISKRGSHGGEYPAGYSKTDRANLRCKCRDNFKLEDGLLYYRKRLLVFEKRLLSIVRLNIASLGMDVSLLTLPQHHPSNFHFFLNQKLALVYIHSYVSIVNNFKEKLLLPRCECMGVISSKRGSDL